MSVFRVNLNNSVQGTLDLNPATTAEFVTSVQRTVYVTGPNKIYRKLADGDTFTDCNYWKKFARCLSHRRGGFIGEVRRICC
jgi:hypothetical protein